MIDPLVTLFYGYWLVGILFGVYFVGWGAARLDDQAKAMNLGVRLLLLPGSAALWPLLLVKAIQHRPNPSTDSNPALP